MIISTYKLNIFGITHAQKKKERKTGNEHLKSGSFTPTSNWKIVWKSFNIHNLCAGHWKITKKRIVNEQKLKQVIMTKYI